MVRWMSLWCPRAMDLFGSRTNPILAVLERCVEEDATMIISIHIPKTAGTSFQLGLKQKFGDRLLHDYTDLPLSDSASDRWRRLRSRLAVSRRRDDLRRSYDVIHGHFIASKYSSLTHDAAFCVFVRDPVTRVISQYKYWQANPDPRNSMYRKFDADGMSLARFASLPRQRRIFALFTAGWPAKRFAFIGITEEYELSLDLFAEIFGIRIPHHRNNVTTGTDEELDARERRAVEAAQRANQPIYDKYRRRFDDLCRRHL